MSPGLSSDGVGSLDSEELGLDDLLAAASDVFPLPLASSGFVPDFFLSPVCALSPPLVLRLFARAGGPESTDLR